MLDIGLDRKHGRLGSAHKPTPLMSPEPLPGARWANSSKAIDTTKRRSPILGGGSSPNSASSSRNNRQVPSAAALAALKSTPDRPGSGSVLKRLDETIAAAAVANSSSTPSPGAAHRQLAPIDDQSLLLVSASPGTSVSPAAGLSHSQRRRLSAATPANKRRAVTSGVFSSPVKLNRARAENIDFSFVTDLHDPIKQQLRRAESIIAAIPNKESAAQLPSVVDNGNPMSSAAVLDGLSRRVALLQHDKSRSDRTASAVMGTHVAALLDLSRSLALTDPNAAEVAQRVHEVLTSHVVKSVEEPLERVSALCDAARQDAARAQDECTHYKAQLLDLQAEVNALRRQMRRRNDLIQYLTSAYNLPQTYMNSVMEGDGEEKSSAMAEEASPVAMIKDHRRGMDRSLSEHSRKNRRPSSRSRSPDGGGDDDDDDVTIFDPNKSLQEQFAVRIPTAEEKAAFMNNSTKPKSSPGRGRR